MSCNQRYRRHVRQMDLSNDQQAAAACKNPLAEECEDRLAKTCEDRLKEAHKNELAAAQEDQRSAERREEQRAVARISQRVQQQLIIHHASNAIGFITASLGSAVQSVNRRVPYHTSSLSGEEWVRELLTGHPERIRCELGVHQHVFNALIADLRMRGHEDSTHVSLNEQLSIFLYICVTGLPLRHVGERFQRSNNTLSKCEIIYLHDKSSAIDKHIDILDISKECCSYSPPHLSTQRTFNSLEKVLQYLEKYATTEGFIPSSKTRLVQSMAVIFLVPALHTSAEFIQTARVSYRRTVCLRVRSISFLHTHIRVGRGPQMMCAYTKLPAP